MLYAFPLSHKTGKFLKSSTITPSNAALFYRNIPIPLLTNFNPLTPHLLIILSLRMTFPCLLIIMQPLANEIHLITNLRSPHRNTALDGKHEIDRNKHTSEPRV